MKSTNQPINLINQSPGTILPIALMAFAIVAFLVLVFLSVNSQTGQQDPGLIGTSNSNIETNQQNSSTKVCINSKYGYQFSYPSNWQVWTPGQGEARRATCDENLALVIVAEDLMSDYIHNQLNITVYTRDNQSSEFWTGVSSLDNYLEKFKRPVKNEITLGGQRWVHEQNSSDASSGIETFVTYHDNALFEFEARDVDQKILDEIMASFSFTSPTAGWKTYRNTTFDYSIKYPSDFQVSESSPTTNDVSFGSERTLGSDFRIRVYENSTTSVDQAIANMGSEFSDRVEFDRKQVSFNGITAIVVAVGTPSLANRYLVSVVFEKNNKVFQISNGFLANPEFQDFYSSFSLTR